MNKYSCFIIAAGMLWGTTGILSRTMAEMGFSTFETAAARLGGAAILMTLTVLIKDRRLFKIRLRDIWLPACIGLFSIFSMSLLYITAIDMSSLSAAAILLNTAPFFVTIISAVVFKERITLKSAAALIIAFAGCVLTAGPGGKMSAAGIACGIGSGAMYATYSIFGKLALKKYNTYTVTVWSFIFAGAAAQLFANPVSTVQRAVSNGIAGIAAAVLIGVITAVLPYILYTTGLSGTMPGKASVMATSEPLAATLSGLIVFGEVPSVLGFAGLGLIVFAILMLNNFGIPEKKRV